MAVMCWCITVHNTMDKLYLYELIGTTNQRRGLSLSSSFVGCDLDINYCCRQDEKSCYSQAETLLLKYV